MRLSPVSDDYIDKVALELVNWAVFDEQALTIERFCVLKGLHPAVIYDWIERNENFKRAHSFAIMAIGDRREHGALRGELNASMVLQSMAMFSKKWRELGEWRAKLNLDNSQGNRYTNVTVVVPDLESSKDVE